MATLSEGPMRSSLQVAPLSILKTRPEPSNNGPDQAACKGANKHAEMTPPATPNGSQEDLSEGAISPPVFHNFLRAFYPFCPSYVMSDATVTIPLNEGDVILVHSIHTNGWADGTLLVSGVRGWLPTNYCEPYDPEEMTNLLKALLNFWDLLRSGAVNNSEILCNQEFMKGVIAGVRYLLERTHCLTRESALIQRHDGLRRCRKMLLSELSSLVKSAKCLQETQKTVDLQHEEQVNDIIDQMILKAFKIVIRGVRFLDIFAGDQRSRMVPAVTVMATVLEENAVPPMPPADSIEANGGLNVGMHVDCRADGATTAAEMDSSYTSDAAQAAPLATKRLSPMYPPRTSTYRLSRSKVQVSRLSSAISHRVSLAGPSPFSRLQNLVSERLSSCHDAFLSHLGAFIGRLQLQSQSRPHLALAVRQSASSGGQLLVVIDIVCSHNSVSLEALGPSRTVMYDRIRDLVHIARDILTGSGSDMEDVIVPQDNNRLLWAATSCVKATGECVAKTKWVIERIGDFEFELEGPPSCDSTDADADLDYSTLDTTSEERERRNSAKSASIAESLAESNVSTLSETQTTISAASGVSIASASTSSGTPRPLGSSIDKPLPQVPQIQAPDEDECQSQAASAASRPQSPAIENSGPSAAASLLSSCRQLPPLPKISTTLQPAEEYSPVDNSASNESDMRSFRSESMTASSSGSGSTYLSRDSESSIMSQTSTRATTPDITLVPRSQPSLSELSATGSATSIAEEVDEVESKLLERTYAHELMFNKEGQVTGGSLAALVERLTMHESTPDAMFVSTFYLTFRLFCTPLRLAEVLIERFDYVEDSPIIAGPVRLRTYNVFKGWLESHWRHESDCEALALIRPFAECRLGSLLPSAGKRLLELADKVSSSDGSLVPRLMSSMGKTGTSVSQHATADAPCPAPIMTRSQSNTLTAWKAGGSSPSILDFDPVEIARQLTIKQMNVFCSILPEELLGSKWTKRGGVDAPNVKAMVSFTTGLSNFVADTILQYEEVKKRASVVKHWIKIANSCLTLNNYDALMAVTCALTDTSIKRLKITWENVNAKRKEMLRSLQTIVDLNQNYKVLRTRLHDHVPPCLPFLGMFLTDLTFVDVGNPANKTSDTGLVVINFDKHMRTAKCIGELQRFQIPYRLNELPDFQEWLQSRVIGDQEKDSKPGVNIQASHYRKSLLLEPREVQQLRTPVEGTVGPFGWMRGNGHNQGLQGQI